MQCKRPGGMTHGIIMAASGTEGSSQGEFIIINQKFIIINLQNSNYFAAASGTRWGGGTVAGNSGREIENLITRWSKTTLNPALEVCSRESLDAHQAFVKMVQKLLEICKNNHQSWRLKAFVAWTPLYAAQFFNF